jgi:prolyl 4-hydroxylase
MAHKRLIDDDWKAWIWSNIKNGIEKQIIYNKLIENNFDKLTVMNELNFIPERLTNNLESTSDNLETSTRDRVINQLTYLGAERIDVEIPLFKFNNLFTENECNELIAIHRELNEPSTTGQKKDIKQEKGRTSFSTFYEHKGLLKTRPIVKTLKFKILGLLGIPAQYSENIQGQWYKPGGFYNDHFDAHQIREKIDPKIRNKTWTCMVNLNEPEEGGLTSFPVLNKTFEPKTGQALIWYNLNEEGLAHPSTLHTGKHVIKGEKFIATQWFHQNTRII